VAMSPDDIQRRQRAIHRYLDADPNQSLHQIAKRLNNDFGNPLQEDHIARIRDEWLAARKKDPLPPPNPYITKRPVDGCPRCKGPHFISQCTAPLPTPPILLMVEVDRGPAVVPNLEVPVEEVMPEAPPPVASIVATAPHPEARKRTTGGRMLRRQWINEYLEQEPGVDPTILLGKLKEAFGIGLDWRYIYDTCRIAREIHKLPQIPEAPRLNGRAPGPREPMPTYAPGELAEDDFSDSPDEECKWLAQQANDIMRAHGLTELRMVMEGGKARWTFKVVREESGEVTF